MPTTVVVDDAGVIRWIDVHPNYTTRSEVPEILAAVDAASSPGSSVTVQGRAAYRGNTASMALMTSGASGSVRGRNRLTTAPSGATRNFSKFH